MVEGLNSRMSEPGRTFSISTAAELSGVGIRSVRLYEARGLVEPVRTKGGTRRYSREDIVRLRRVRDLMGDGMNLASVGVVMMLQDENVALRRELANLKRQSSNTGAGGAVSN